jgi:hypothetical protein
LKEIDTLEQRCPLVRIWVPGLCACSLRAAFDRFRRQGERLQKTHAQTGWMRSDVTSDEQDNMAEITYREEAKREEVIDMAWVPRFTRRWRMKHPADERERHDGEHQDDADGENEVKRKVDWVQDPAVQILVTRTDRADRSKDEGDQQADVRKDGSRMANKRLVGLPVDISAVACVAPLSVDLLLAGRSPELVAPLAEVVEEGRIPIVPIDWNEAQRLRRRSKGTRDGQRPHDRACTVGGKRTWVHHVDIEVFSQKARWFWTGSL